MKKTLLVASLLCALYFVKIFAQATLSERKAESVVKQMLTDIATPWNGSQIRNHGSDWLLNTAKLTPEDLASLGQKDLGTLREIKKAKCGFREGFEKSQPDQRRTWAVCDVNARFEKLTVVLTIRMVEEPPRAAQLFGLLGDGLKFNDFMSIKPAP